MLDPPVIPLLALLTDFGNGSAYVAQMKGVIHGMLSAVNFVDVTHSIAPQGIEEAAWVLADSAAAFPENTAFLAVVDPGVGSQRALLAARGQRYWYLGPDNGIFSLVARIDPLVEVVFLNQSRFWRRPTSATFHGRDILAPVAAHLMNGVPLDQLGAPTDQYQRLEFPAAVFDAANACIRGRLEYADSFGNLITNIPDSLVQQLSQHGRLVVSCGELQDLPLVRCYADATPGSPVALIGSCGRLELAVVNGHAQQTLALEKHSQIRCGLSLKTR